MKCLEEIVTSECFSYLKEHIDKEILLDIDTILVDDYDDITKKEDTLLSEIIKHSKDEQLAMSILDFLILDVDFEIMYNELGFYPVFGSLWVAIEYQMSELCKCLFEKHPVFVRCQRDHDEIEDYAKNQQMQMVVDLYHQIKMQVHPLIEYISEKGLGSLRVMEELLEAYIDIDEYNINVSVENIESKRNLIDKYKMFFYAKDLNGGGSFHSVYMFESEETFEALIYIGSCFCCDVRYVEIVCKDKKEMTINQMGVKDEWVEYLYKFIICKMRKDYDYCTHNRCATHKLTNEEMFESMTEGIQFKSLMTYEVYEKSSIIVDSKSEDDERMVSCLSDNCAWRGFYMNRFNHERVKLDKSDWMPWEPENVRRCDGGRNTKRKIAFAGKICSGKSTTARYFKEKYNGKIYSFGSAVKTYCSEIFDMQYKNRELIQEFAQKVKEIDMDVWVKYTVRQMEKDFREHSNIPMIIVDDLRFPNEAKILKENNFFIIELNIDESFQEERIKHTYPETFSEHLARRDDISETYIGKGQLYADVSVKITKENQLAVFEMINQKIKES